MGLLGNRKIDWLPGRVWNFPQDSRPFSLLSEVAFNRAAMAQRRNRKKTTE